MLSTVDVIQPQPVIRINHRVSTTSQDNATQLLTAWQPPPQLTCVLHVDATGRIQHAEGQIHELFGIADIRNGDLAAYLRSPGKELRLAAWLAQTQTEKLVLRAQLLCGPGQFTPVELRASYQGNGLHLLNIRSIFQEIVYEFAGQQVTILEMLAHGRPQSEILTRLIMLIEDVMPGAIGSILLLNRATNCFVHGAAPHLPETYTASINGLPSGPDVGSCGAALHKRQRTVVTDIATDPLWADYRHYILPFGFQACWSTPFFAEDGTSLGAFGIYYREKRAPYPHEIAIVDAASHLASVVVSHTINQQRLQNALTALQQSEDRLQTTFDFLNDAIFVHDHQTGAIVDANQRAVEMYGWTKQELLRFTIGDLSAGTRPYSQQDALDWIRRAENDGPQLFEWRARDRNSRLFWVEVNLRYARIGAQQRVLVTVRDISARKLIEERLELALRGTDLSLWDWDIPSGTVSIGERWLTALGYSQDDLPNTVETWRKLLHPEDSPATEKAIAEHFSGRTDRYDVEFRLLHKNGTWKWVHTRGRVVEWSADGKPLRMTGSHLDIHVRKTAEERIRENQRVLETLLGNLVGMAYRCRIDEYWTMEFVSQGCLPLTGYKPEDIVNNRRISYEELTHPEDRQMVRDTIYAALEQGRQFELAYRITKADSMIRTVWERGIGIRSPDGKLEFLEGFITDITDIQHSQAMLAEQAALLDRAQDAIIVRDLLGIITFWNQGATRVYGWTREEATGKRVLDLFYREESPYLDSMQELLTKGEWAGEQQHITNTGREIAIEGRWTLLRDQRGNPKSVLSINTDITEKKRLEAQFLRAQRMESIGTLAGGIAHDLNNVLAPIIMSIDLLKLSSRSTEELELLSQMETSAHRGADLVRQVLSFARGVGGRRVTTNPSHLIRDIVKIMKETFPRSITIKTHRSDDLWMVSGDPTQLHQVLLNLCVNARDAMAEGGTLSILAENIDVSDAMAGQMENALPGNYVRFIVEDTGSGIPTDILGKIFEPFFTTKEIGKGTGLGLSTAMAIVRSHGGFIQVESQPDQGTTFYVYLPSSNLSLEPDLPLRPSNVPCGNGEFVLIVDDESSVRSVLKNMLTTFGYQVILAENGATALALYEKEKHRISVIITDMMMPVMDGATMIAAIRKMAPHLPIIACSGLYEQTSIGRATAAGVNHFLAKPYTVETILRTLHEVLISKPSSCS